MAGSWEPEEATRALRTGGSFAGHQESAASDSRLQKGCGAEYSTRWKETEVFSPDGLPGLDSGLGNPLTSHEAGGDSELTRRVSALRCLAQN